MDLHDRLRELPSVDEVLGRLNSQAKTYPRELVVSEVRRVLDAARERIRAGEETSESALDTEVLKGLDRLSAASLRRIINATGVVLHTNLGRAPLAHVDLISGYSNLEYDLGTGKRGKRDTHIGLLLERLLDVPGIAVNNNAAAVYLVLNELAAGHEVIVSRGELIEIGDGFRIPDIMARSGAILREIGTTNRTSLDDYRNAFTERTRLILRVHPSNFHISGFTARPSLPHLAALAEEKQVPLYEDLGSGCLVDLKPYGVDEPVVRESVQAGASVVSFSGDKLLGGPQAGIIAGRADLVARIRRNPMFRALRLDKLIYQSLETTLRHVLLEQWNEVPVLRMIAQSAGQIRERAARLVTSLPPDFCSLIEGRSVLGGGSTPDQSMPTWLISIHSAGVAALERELRLGDPPVIARIEHQQLLLDLRTVAESEEEDLLKRLRDVTKPRGR
ncbi:MAG: L-seryl-tRNA(Sec) selenium transferase [Bryobacteraceae bacterium]